MIDQADEQGRAGRCQDLIMELAAEGKVPASLCSPQLILGCRKTTASTRLDLCRCETQRR